MRNTSKNTFAAVPNMPVAKRCLSTGKCPPESGITYQEKGQVDMGCTRRHWSIYTL